MQVQNESFHWKKSFHPHAILFSLLGAIFSAIALNGFMIPNKFLDGGVIGISILIHEFFHYNISLPLVVLNLPFLWIGLAKIGKQFALQTLITIFFLVCALNWINIGPVTSDKILIALFGGFLMGIGTGFAIKAGSVIDGMEVIADYTYKKLGLTSSEIVLILNSIVILIAAMSFGLEVGMYSILTYFTAMKASDYVVDGFEEYTAMTIISPRYEAIKSLIVNDFKKAISVYKGERGYLPGSFAVHTDCEIIVTVLTRLEIHRIKDAIHRCDPGAFLYIQSIKEVTGGVVKKKKVH